MAKIRTITISTYGNGAWEATGNFVEWDTPDVVIESLPSKMGLSQVVDGKIEYIMNFVLGKGALEHIEEDPLFSEVCDFYHENSGVKFRGTWADAIRYIYRVSTEEARSNP